MTNRLTEIRAAAVDLLKQRFQRVYSGRAFAPAQAQLPCVVVYFDSRRSEAATMDYPPVYRHTARLITLVCVQANENADALAEEMLALIGQVFAESPDFNMGADGLDDLSPDLLNIESVDGGEVATVYYQQGWSGVYFEQGV